MDEALEKAYNKPAKNQSGIIGISCRKEAVANWNIINKDKSKFVTFLWELCNLDEQNEYSLQHEFSAAVTDSNKHFFFFVIDYIMNRRHPFKFSDNKDLAIIVV